MDKVLTIKLLSSAPATPLKKYFKVEQEHSICCNPTGAHNSKNKVLLFSQD